MSDEMSWTKTRSILANEKRRNPNADITELLRQMKAEKLADHIQRVVESAPPLTDEQCDEIARLLSRTIAHGNDSGAGDGASRGEFA